MIDEYDYYALLRIIKPIVPVGEPFNDALCLVCEALTNEDPDERERARNLIHGKLRVREALLQNLKAATVEKARAKGHGSLKFNDAVVALGDDYESLHDAYVLQLEQVVR